jgi:hypothetical protein
VEDLMQTPEFQPQSAFNLTGEVLTAPVPTACLITGWSRSEMYRRLAAGDIQAVKMGKRTLIVMDSVRTYVATLPRAVFRRPQQPA